MICKLTMGPGLAVGSGAKPFVVAGGAGAFAAAGRAPVAARVVLEQEADAAWAGALNEIGPA
jgi:hypothetical protein